MFLFAPGLASSFPSVDFYKYLDSFAPMVSEQTIPPYLSLPFGVVFTTELGLYPLTNH